MYAICRNGELAASIDAEFAKQTEHPSHETALQEGTVVAEGEMVRAPDRDTYPCIRRQPIVNRVYVSCDLIDFRGRREITLATQEEHEGLVDACLNDAAVQGTVHINTGFAP